jgi:hypothetical protein
MRYSPIKAEIRVSHRIERERCFNTPTPFHTETIGKLSVIEQFEHTIGQNSGVVARHKKSRLPLQDQFRSAPSLLQLVYPAPCIRQSSWKYPPVYTAAGSENSHSEEISDTFYIFTLTKTLYARQMFGWDAIAHVPERFVVADSHKSNGQPSAIKRPRWRVGTAAALALVLGRH